MSSDTVVRFDALALPPFLLAAIAESGYEIPTPIQAQAIPVLLEGRDVRGLAQTGTGKTAAFALPVLAQIDPAINVPQALILAPTRELAIQVCAALDKYAAHLPGFRSLAIYGGQSMSTQLHALNRGVHVVVGTPGRVMDHLRRKSLLLKDISMLVLDEADEMLRMGFIEDVEWILEHTPEARQTALFSATMPPMIAKITHKYQKDPVEIRVQTDQTTQDNIKHFFAEIHPGRKAEGLIRLLEVEERDAAIIFVRTKATTVELEQALQQVGYACSAINGDMNQRQREEAIQRLRSGGIDILIATDVAARGIDVPRVSHVINYDLPMEREAYVHRIGRTGRAGREGKAIALVSRRDWRNLKNIERHMRIQIEETFIPDDRQLAKHRREKLRVQLAEIIADKQLDECRQMVLEMSGEGSLEDTAAALLYLIQSRPVRTGDKEGRPARTARSESHYSERDRDSGPRRFSRERSERGDRPGRSAAGERRPRPERSESPRFGRDSSERPRFSRERPDHSPALRTEPRSPRGGRPEVDNYRVEVGKVHGATPRDIVGAIANEAGVESRLIGRIDLHDDYSTIEMPAEMPVEVYKAFSNLWVRNQRLNPSRVKGSPRAAESRPVRAKVKPKARGANAAKKAPPKLKRKYVPPADSKSGGKRTAL
ncbi:MAG: DEAD/DEAH box helicase [Gammaproteobacteria bacterium]|nr:DEAD/DEAH box helicase [Gammaproteobacteria bacterium]